MLSSATWDSQILRADDLEEDLDEADHEDIDDMEGESEEE